MPVSLVRARPSRKAALLASATVLELISEVSDALGATPIKGAAQILLSVLKIIENVDNIEDGRLRLANRATCLLIAIRKAVASHQDCLPEQLEIGIQTFENVLHSIHAYVQSLANERWLSRFLYKSRIDENLIKLNSDLDTAFDSFQAWILISIHASQEQMVAAWKVSSPPTSMNYHSRVGAPSIPDKLLDPNCIEDCGFPIYRQFEVVYVDDISLPVGNAWQHITIAEIAGIRKGLVRRYEGPNEEAKRAWLMDLKIWRRVHHPHLLQLIGISDEKAALPFLVFANSDLYSLSTHMLSLLKAGSIASCVTEIMHIYSTVHSAVIHVRQQLLLNDIQTNKFACSFSLSMNSKSRIIVVINGQPGGDSCPSPGNRVIDLSIVLSSRVTPGALFFDRVHISAAGFLETLTKESMFSSAEIADAERLEWKMHHVRTILRTIMPLMSDTNLHPFLGILPFSQVNTLPSTMPTLRVPSLRSLRAVPIISADMNFPSSSLLIAKSCWFENSNATLGDVGYFKRKHNWGLGFLGLETAQGASSKQCDRIPAALLYDDSQLEGSKFKKALHIGSHRCSGNEYGSWAIHIPTGGATQLQLYIHTQLSCSEPLHWRHVPFLLKEGPVIAAKYGLAPHQITILSGNIDCYVYAITSTLSDSRSIVEDNQRQSGQTVTLFEAPGGGLSFSELEHCTQFIFAGESYQLTLRHHHIESEFTVLSEEDYAEDSDLPDPYLGDLASSPNPSSTHHL